MPDKSFHPYKFAEDALAVQLRSIAIGSNSIPLEEVYNEESLHIGLAGRAIPELLSLRIQVSDQASEIVEGLPGGKQEIADLEVVLKIAIPATRMRWHQPCSRTDTGKWEGFLTFSPDVLAGRIEIEPRAVRMSDRRPVDGFAFRKGEEIAGGTSLVVELDARPALPGNAMDSEWIDFGAESSPAELRKRKDTVWYLDLANPERPRILLNQGVDGLRPALEVTANHGRAAALRDTLAGSILLPALMALAMEAVVSWSSDEEPRTEGWRYEVLKLLAGKAGDMTERLQLEEWLDAWRSGDRASVVHGFQTAVQRHVESPDTVTAILKAHEAMSNG